MIESLNESLTKKSYYNISISLGVVLALHKNYSYMELHRISNRATPSKTSEYNLALQLYKVFNDRIPKNELINLNLEIVITSRQTKFATRRLNNIKILD